MYRIFFRSKINKYSYISINYYDISCIDILHCSKLHTKNNMPKFFSMCHIQKMDDDQMSILHEIFLQRQITFSNFLSKNVRRCYYTQLVSLNIQF